MASQYNRTWLSRFFRVAVCSLGWFSAVQIATSESHWRDSLRCPRHLDLPRVFVGNGSHGIFIYSFLLRESLPFLRLGAPSSETPSVCLAIPPCANFSCANLPFFYGRFGSFRAVWMGFVWQSSPPIWLKKGKQRWSIWPTLKQGLLELIIDGHTKDYQGSGCRMLSWINVIPHQNPTISGILEFYVG